MTNENLARAIDYFATQKDDVDVLTLAPGLSYDDAYRAQFASKVRQAALNGPIIGYQASFTSEGAKKFGPPDMPKPYFGTLQLRNWHDPAVPVQASRVFTGVECEVGMRMAAPLKGPGVTVADARAAVASVHAAFELVPLTQAPGGRSGQHMVAGHNFGSHILFSKQAGAPEWDLRQEPIELYCDGVLTHSAVGGDSGGDPFAVLAELANTLGRFGMGLEPGMVVMTGSATPPHPLAAGTQRVEGRFGRLGSISASFVWP